MLLIVIFITCSYLGFIYGESYKKRLEDLKECYKAILLLHNQIVFNNTPLPEALSLIANKVGEPYCSMFSIISSDLYDGKKEDVYEAFKDSYHEHEENIFLNKEDLKVICDLINSLGDSGVYGQEKIFKLTLGNLKTNIEEAEELSNKNRKLYRYLGICFGAMISIILI
jgi:stage III sporulation protein AB